MRLRKLVGTILTGALLMTSGITAFAAVPDGTMILKLPVGFVDVAYSTEYLNTKAGEPWQKWLNSPSGYAYFKQNGEIRSLKDNSILPKEKLRKTVYFDVKKVMNLERDMDIIMDNEVYSLDFVLEKDTKALKNMFYPSIGFDLYEKYKKNGIIGDCVAKLRTQLLDTESVSAIIKRSDYPRLMNYYYTDTYEAGDGDKIK